jgi:hypothetical protein
MIVSRPRAERRSSGKTAPLHIDDGCFFSRPIARVSRFLPIKPIVILIKGSLGPAATLLIRASLGAGQLDRVAVQPARPMIIPEPAEPLSLLRISPDHQVPLAADSRDVNVSFLHPVLKPEVAHAELVRQVADPPLVGRQRLRRPASRTETESVDQIPGPRRGEPLVAVRYRTEALSVEALGDLLECLTGRDPRLDQAPHPRKIAQTLVTTDLSPQTVLGRCPSDPFNTEHGVLGGSPHRHGHPLDKGADDLLSVRRRGITGVPQGRDIGGQGPDAVDLLRGGSPRRLATESIVTFAGFL